MTDQASQLEAHKPEIITSGVIDVVSYYEHMEPNSVIEELLQGNYVLVEDYYHSGLQVLRSLKDHLELQYNTNNFLEDRKFRGAYRDASHRLLLMVEDHKLLVKKSPDIGWFEELYPEEEIFLISYPDVQGLNSSWQWYINGLDIEALNITIHPYYGIYFPTRFDHIEIFEEWLRSYKGEKRTAIDIGLGCGVLSFQLAQHGFSKIVGTDINENAIISVNRELDRLLLTADFELYHGDLFADFDGKADLIVFNPPWLEATHELEMGIDKAIYYEDDLFPRFFRKAKEHLEEDGKLILLFSNLGQIVGKDVRHPIYYEIQNHDRFEKVDLISGNVKSASKKTRRKDRREGEKIELWVLSHKSNRNQE